MKPIPVARGAPKVTHLAFDPWDLLLFVEASNLNLILDLFCRISGQKVSQEKICIYISKEVPWKFVTQICKTFSNSLKTLANIWVTLFHNIVNKDPLNLLSTTLIKGWAIGKIKRYLVDFFCVQILSPKANRETAK